MGCTIIIFIQYVDNGKYVPAIMNNHQEKKLNYTLPPYLLVENANTTQFDDLTFQIPLEFMNNVKYVSIAYSKTPIQNYSQLPKHDYIITTKFNYTIEADACFSNFFVRISGISIEFFFIEETIYIILLLTVVYLRDEQPLKSRSIFPSISILIQYLLSLSPLQIYFMNSEQTAKYSCYASSFAFLNLSCLISILVPLNYIRFFLLAFLNQRKEEIRKDRHALFYKSIIFLRKFSNPNISMIIILFYLLVSNSIVLMIMSIFNFECTTDLNGIINIIYGIISLLTLILLIFIGCLDTFIHFLFCTRDLEKKKTIKKYMFSKLDPFYFRIEFIIGVIFSSFYFIGFLLTIGGEIVSTSQIEFQIFLNISSIFITIYHYGLLFYQVILVLFITIILMIKRNISSFFKKNINQKDSMDQIMSHEILSEQFKDFCEKEWSLENFLCYEDIEKYKKSMNEWKRKEIAYDILYTYFNGDSSPLSVNCSFGTLKVIREKLDFKRGNQTEFPDELFEEALKEIKNNLADTYSRYIDSSEYQTFVKNSSFLDKEMK
eukprot:gene4176-7486_t